MGITTNSMLIRKGLGIMVMVYEIELPEKAMEHVVSCKPEIV
jgi:hypothetical protein